MFRKRFANQFIVFIAGVLILSGGCRYEEGPKIGFRSVKTRLAGKWVIESVEKNGKDETGDYKKALVDYTLEIIKEGTYNINYRPFNLTDYKETGVWITGSDKKTITFTQNTGNDPGAKSTWVIKRLTHTELWATYTDTNGDQLYLKLKP